MAPRSSRAKRDSDGSGAQFLLLNSVNQGIVRHTVALDAGKGLVHMEQFIMRLTTVIVAASAILGLAAATAPASAYVVCNRDGDCWHSDARVRVPGVTFD